MGRVTNLLDSDYGRSAGWQIELDGIVVGELVRPRFVDMFWYQYDVVPRDSRGSEALTDSSNWEQCRFLYRSKALGEVVSTAVCGGSKPYVRDGKVSMRALYLTTNGWWEGVMETMLIRARATSRLFGRRPGPAT